MALTTQIDQFLQLLTESDPVIGRRIKATLGSSNGIGLLFENDPTGGWRVKIALDTSAPLVVSEIIFKNPNNSGDGAEDGDWRRLVNASGDFLTQQLVSGVWITREDIPTT